MHAQCFFIIYLHLHWHNIFIQIAVGYIYSVQSSDAYMRQQLLITFYIGGSVERTIFAVTPAILKDNNYTELSTVHENGLGAAASLRVTLSQAPLVRKRRLLTITCGQQRFSGSKWQGLLSSYNWYHFSSVVVGVSRSLIVSPNALLQLHLHRSVVIIMSTDSDILARARRPQHEANYLLHSTPLRSCSSWRLLSHCSVWSFPAVWRHSLVWHTIEGDADRRSEWESVLRTSQRTNAHFNKVVQPTRPTGIEGRRGCGESTSCWW